MSIFDVLTKDNWRQGSINVDHDTPCLGIAMVDCDQGSDPAWDAMSSIIKSEYPERVGDPGSISVIMNFNDHPDTTWDDIEWVVQKYEANQ